MTPKPDPVTMEEVARATVTAIMQAFGDRPMEINTARRGLAQAAFDLRQLEGRKFTRLENGGREAYSGSGTAKAGSEGGDCSLRQSLLQEAFIK